MASAYWFNAELLTRDLLGEKNLLGYHITLLFLREFLCNLQRDYLYLNYLPECTGKIAIRRVNFTELYSSNQSQPT